LLENSILHFQQQFVGEVGTFYYSGVKFPRDDPCPIGYLTQKNSDPSLTFE